MPFASRRAGGPPPALNVDGPTTAFDGSVTFAAKLPLQPFATDDRFAVHIAVHDKGGAGRSTGAWCDDGEPMDDDLETMTAGQLAALVKKLRRGIRAHRDGSGQELCWHHPAL